MRITERMLKKKVEYLNRLSGFDSNPPYSTIGAYDLDFAYGGVTLVQYVSNGGGVHTPLPGGFVSKRELMGLIESYIAGMEAGK